MLSVPPAARQTRAWQQKVRSGTREDRTLREITVCIPEHIKDLSLTIPGELAQEIDAATAQIANLEATAGSTLAPISSLLLRTESVASSKIEMISASIEDYARATHGNRSNDSATSMVAATSAISELLSSVTTDRKIGLPQLLNAHRTLMVADSFESDYAGRMRDMQNWVGGSDYSPRHALLIPPPPELLPELLADLIDFCNRADLPALVQATIAHAQFETIHPFTDGNGRIGRALINAVLRARGLTSHVVIPIALALVSSRENYFASLESFRNGDLEPILHSFASATKIAAAASEVTANNLVQISRHWQQTLGRSRTQSAPNRLLELLQAQPAITATDAQQWLGIGTSGTYAALSRLETVGIIHPLTSRQRNQVWAAGAILQELDDLDSRIQSEFRTAVIESN